MSETKFWTRGKILAAAALGVAVAGGASAAVVKFGGGSMGKVSACGGGWWPTFEIDYRVAGIAIAEKDLAAGKYGTAAGAVIRMIPHIKGYKSAQSDAIINRSMRVLAVALARMKGDLSGIRKELPEELLAEFAGTSDAAHEGNIAWAVAALEGLQAAKKNDSTISTELGEAMAQLPAKHSAAKELLEKLAKADLLATPEGYRALAVLRAAAKDDAGRTEALERCKKMAADAAICTAPATAGNDS
jgi:hypothetical protein